MPNDSNSCPDRAANKLHPHVRMMRKYVEMPVTSTPVPSSTSGHGMQEDGTTEPSTAPYVEHMSRLLEQRESSVQTRPQQLQQRKKEQPQLQQGKNSDFTGYVKAEEEPEYHDHVDSDSDSYYTACNHQEQGASTAAIARSMTTASSYNTAQLRHASSAGSSSSTRHERHNSHASSAASSSSTRHELLQSAGKDNYLQHQQGKQVNVLGESNHLQHQKGNHSKQGTYASHLPVLAEYFHYTQVKQGRVSAQGVSPAGSAAPPRFDNKGMNRGVSNGVGKGAMTETTGPPPRAPPGLEMMATPQHRAQGALRVAVPEVHQGLRNAKTGMGKNMGNVGLAKGQQNGNGETSMLPGASTNGNAQARFTSSKQGQQSPADVRDMIAKGYTSGKGSHQHAGKGPVLSLSGLSHYSTIPHTITPLPVLSPSAILTKGALLAIMKGTKGAAQAQHFNTPVVTAPVVPHLPLGVVPLTASNMLQHQRDQLATSAYSNLNDHHHHHHHFNHHHDTAAQLYHHAHLSRAQGNVTQEHAVGNRPTSMPRSTWSRGTHSPAGLSDASTLDSVGRNAAYEKLAQDALARVVRGHKANGHNIARAARNNSQRVNAGAVVDEQSEDTKLEEFFSGGAACGNPVCRRVMPVHCSGIRRVFCKNCINFMATQCCKEGCKQEDLPKLEPSLLLIWDRVYEELRQLLPDLKPAAFTIPTDLGDAAPTDSEMLKICYAAWPFLFGLERKNKQGVTNGAAPRSSIRRHFRGFVSYSGKYLVKLQATEYNSEHYEKRQGPANLPEVITLKYAAASKLECRDRVCMTLDENDIVDPLFPYTAALQHEARRCG
ncbi:unnamed protein product [Amoebophrya sp. A25]|nr:unnamed protein product [Amoebophrya sp. A25]|eukprot:GSA25T00027061001.1